MAIAFAIQCPNGSRIYANGMPVRRLGWVKRCTKNNKVFEP